MISKGTSISLRYLLQMEIAMIYHYVIRLEKTAVGEACFS